MALNFSLDGRVAFLYSSDTTLHWQDEITHEGEEMLDEVTGTNEIAREAEV
jgi:hypothetical protein